MKSQIKFNIRNSINLFSVALIIGIMFSFSSCKKIVKKEYTCKCQCYDISNGTTQEISRETIFDTEEKARTQCEDKWIGDECGCTIL